MLAACQILEMSACMLQIVLYEGAGEGIKLSSEDQYDTALAYLAEGYCSRRPQHVRTAHRLLAPLHNKTGAGTADIGECMRSQHQSSAPAALMVHCQDGVAIGCNECMSMCGTSIILSYILWSSRVVRKHSSQDAALRVNLAH